MPAPDPGVSRRRFLGTTAAGVAAAAAVSTVPTLSASAGSAAPELDTDDDGGAVLDQPVVARVTDLAAGEVTLFVGTEELSVTDRTLARRLARAAKQ